MDDAARSALDRHMDALNERKADSIRASQHFPFCHIWPDGSVEFVGAQTDFEMLDATRLGADWHHSVLEDAEEITRGENAVSYRVEFTRRRADDSVFGRYEAVWIATRIAGDWRVQFRHGAIALTPK